jgi:hypothetical protein
VPVISRGIDVRGGMQKRFIAAGPYLERLIDFVHRIIGRYHPLRVALCWPLYIGAVYGWTVVWIWSDSRLHRTFTARLGATLGLAPLVPWHALCCLLRLRAPSPGPGWRPLPGRPAG